MVNPAAHFSRRYSSRMARVCRLRRVLPFLILTFHVALQSLSTLWGTSTLSALSQLRGPPPLRVAVQNMWLDAAVVLAEMEVLLAPVA